MRKTWFAAIFATALIIIAGVVQQLAAQGVNNLQYVKVITVNLTPAATAASIGTSSQTFSTYFGAAAGDLALVLGPAPTALCPNTAARISAANTLQLDFTTLTAAACTPAAGVYTLYDIKAN